MLRRIFVLLLCAAMLVMGAACGDTDNGQPVPPIEDIEPPPPPEFPVVVGGATVAARPVGVVSLSPALTEKIFDLGLGSRLVGVSDFCDFPEGAERLDRCGTALMPDIEMISRIPNVHLVLYEEGLSAEFREELSRLGIDTVRIPRARTLDELWNSYIALARMFEGEHAGQHMGDMFANALDNWLADLSDAVYAEMRAQAAAAAEEAEGDEEEQEDETLEPLYALYLTRLPFTVATGDTLENELMQLIGLTNIAREQTGWNYPEELAADEGLAYFRALHIIFVNNNLGPGEDGEYLTPQSLHEHEFFSTLPAITGDSYMPIDHSIMERQSMRSFRQLLEMAAHVWPYADLPRWPPAIAFTLN